MSIPSWDGIMPEPTIIDKDQGPLWSGKQLFSLLLPNVHFETEGRTKEEGNVIINSGKLLSGIVDKKTIGDGTNSLIHVLCNEHGSKVTQDFIYEVQLIVNEWLNSHGFSVGISDIIPNEDVRKEFESYIKKKKKEAEETQIKYNSKKITKNIYESQMNQTLGSIMPDVGDLLLKILKNDNNIKQMIDAGSKGKSTNISQIMALVGQQSLDGKRVDNKFQDRTLPHYPKGDMSIESKGFVEHSYSEGLNPQEYFFHAMAGRIGILDTRIKTAQTG